MKLRHTDGIISNEGFDPRNRGVTFSDNPKHPLWKVKVEFPAMKPMLETIKAPTYVSALAYARRRYPDAKAVTYLGKAEPLLHHN